MNLLFRVLYAAHCKSTHHKLAMDALRFLESGQAGQWQNLFLKYHKLYLQGAKDPDKVFKDFRNHVLHVEQNYWGGARRKAREWYDKAVMAFQKKQWAEAVYATGVLSHYYTDPIQPFHTAQSEEENNIHRAAEWSICKAYDTLWQRANGQGLPTVTVPDGDQWLEELVSEGADLGHELYWPLIEHYDFAKGVKDPPTGLDNEAVEMLAMLVGYASVGFSRVLDQLFKEAAVAPPSVSLTVSTVLATLSIPIQWVTKKMADAKERKLVNAMYAELERTGKVSDTLPEDDRMVRDLVAKEMKAEKPVLRVHQPEPTQSAPKPPEPTKTERSRFYLESTSTVEEAPSIGPKTAKRLAVIGIHTVADLLKADPTQVAKDLNTGWTNEQAVRDWQDQARLVSTVPNLRGHDAQILVACDYRTVDAVAGANPQALLTTVELFAQTKAGQRVIRSGKNPDAAEVADWIRWAQSQSKSSRAA